MFAVYKSFLAVPFDQEVATLIKKAEVVARDILQKNLDKLHKLAQMLLELGVSIGYWKRIEC